MKIYNINPFAPNFKGKREDRKSVAQLKENNPYSLNTINQRRIKNAIESLAEVPGQENAEFLLDVAENLKYQTRIDLGKSQFNDWQVKLDDAITEALAKSSPDVQKRLTPRLEKLRETKPLSEDEKQLLNLRSSILSQVDYEQLEQIESENIKQLERNLDYFVISSEVTTAQKLYILKKLNHFISPEYKINPQLADKKTQALAEIINDITIDTPESKIPNIKSVNQQAHGMCAAISICRKALAYEDKTNYVDMIMSELDDSPVLMVYDINKLGSGTKVPISKTRLDFDYALSKGYRIIDTSALYWMHLANTTGSGNEFIGMYSTFDKEDFDTFHDCHLMPNLPTKELEAKQDYYRTLLKAKDAIGQYKKQAEKKQKEAQHQVQTHRKNSEMIVQYNTTLRNILSEIAPDADNKTLRAVFCDLLKLEVKTSAEADKIKDHTQDFVFLPNETERAKLEKINAFLSISLPNKNTEKLNEKTPEILELVQTIKKLSGEQTRSYQSKVYNRALGLYQAAATYRTQYKWGLEVPEVLEDLTIAYKIPDRETRIIKNIDMLIKKLESGKLNPKIQAGLAINLGTENDPEFLIEALKTNRETFVYIMTDLMDSFYENILLGSRKDALINDIEVAKKAIKARKPHVLPMMASNLDVKEDKRKVLDVLDRYTKILQSETCTEEQYIQIFNSIGNKSLIRDFKDKYEELNDVFLQNPPNEEIIAKFKATHNLPADATMEEIENIMQFIGNNFNQTAQVTTYFQQMLEIHDEDGTILNTVMAKPIIMKKLENTGAIIPAKDLRMLQERFSQINRALTNHNGTEAELKDLPIELFTFSKHEKEVLDQIEKKINQWYSSVTRSLKYKHRDIQEELNELHREVGFKKGSERMNEGHSGLAANQQIRIFEHMTDRPYYAETNGPLAIAKIKKSPYSGVTGTSVNHKHPAMHAQYVADIRDVVIRTENGFETKEALFHDNSWGPSEHANTWVDEAELTRTDYRREFGGELGYITDNKYLNGKLVENLQNEIGKTKFNETEEYHFAMHEDTTIAGKSPLADMQVRRIRQNTFIDPTRDFKHFETLTSEKTQTEIREIIGKTKVIGHNAYKDFLDIQRRVFGNPPFDKGIQTKEAYDNLPDSDQLKVLFEKIALLKSYSELPEEKIFFKHSTMEDLQKNKELIRKDARKNFNYAFGKNLEIAHFGAESARNDVAKLLENFAKENNIRLNKKQITAYVNSLKTINKAEFDGSLDKTIELMIASFTTTLTGKLPQIDNKDEKIQVMANQVRDILRTNLGFTLADLDDSSSAKNKLPKHIVNWIDRVMKPYSDEEFVQIYKNLQNMTTVEFEQKYGKTIDDSALGIKPITGFDIVKQFLAMDEKTEDMLFSMLYYQDYEYNVKMGETTPIYDFNKFGKILRGAIYKNKRTLDDLYLDYYYSLKLLSLPNKRYKPLQQLLFDKHGVYFAYPKVDLEEEKEEEVLLRELFNGINESMEEIENCKEKDTAYNTITEVYKFLWKKKPEDIPSSKDRTFVNDKIYSVLEIFGEDDSIADTIKAGQDILSLDDNITYEKLQELISIMFAEMSMYATTLDGKTMLDSAKEEIKEIEQRKLGFVMNVFAPKHQSKAHELLDKYIKARAKNKPNAPELFTDFEDFTKRHRLLKSPEDMLNEYMLLLAKPSDDHGRIYSEREKAQFRDVKEVYRHNILGGLTIANTLDMQYIIMECAKEGNLNIVRDEFRNSQLQLKDGRTVVLDSDEALLSILNPLIHGMDSKTALLFIEQLGLSERVIELYAKEINTKRMCKFIKRIDSIFASANAQLRTIKKENAKLENIDNDTNWVEKIEELRKTLKRRVHNTNYRKIEKLVDASFNDLLDDIEKHPQHSKTALVYLHIEELKSGIMYLAKNDVNRLNMALKGYQRYIDLIKQLQVPPNSPAIEIRNQYLAKIQEVENFAEQHTRRYEDLELHTANADDYNEDF